MELIKKSELSKLSFVYTLDFKDDAKRVPYFVPVKNQNISRNWLYFIRQPDVFKRSRTQFLHAIYVMRHSMNIVEYDETEMTCKDCYVYSCLSDVVSIAGAEGSLDVVALNGALGRLLNSLEQYDHFNHTKRITPWLNDEVEANFNPDLRKYGEEYPVVFYTSAILSKMIDPRVKGLANAMTLSELFHRCYFLWRMEGVSRSTPWTISTMWEQLQFYALTGVVPSSETAKYFIGVYDATMGTWLLLKYIKAFLRLDNPSNEAIEICAKYITDAITSIVDVVRKFSGYGLTRIVVVNMLNQVLGHLLPEYLLDALDLDAIDKLRSQVSMPELKFEEYIPVEKQALAFASTPEKLASMNDIVLPTELNGFSTGCDNFREMLRSKLN